MLTSRNRYFAEIQHQGDLFLDPDTGIATGRVAHPEHYVRPREIWSLLLIPLYELLDPQIGQGSVARRHGPKLRPAGLHSKERSEPRQVNVVGVLKGDGGTSYLSIRHRETRVVVTHLTQRAKERER